MMHFGLIRIAPWLEAHENNVLKREQYDINGDIGMTLLTVLGDFIRSFFDRTFAEELSSQYDQDAFKPVDLSLMGLSLESDPGDGRHFQVY